jgi:glycosyltransferase involved in cell wall biosynthesis
VAESIALCLIVRDNEKTVWRAIGSALEHIDYLVVVDTGSVDGTPDLIREALGLVPGELHQREWVNSGHNRTELLVLARGTADYLLLLDADHELQVDAPLPELTAPVYMLREQYHALTQRMPRLIRGDREWRYIGAAHEYLADTDDREDLDGWTIIHHGDGRSNDVRLAVALAELEEAFASSPADARTVFYLAQTHRDLGNIDQAIFHYRLRCEMGGWDEEVYYARYQLGCLLATNVSFAQGADELLRAWKERPGRIEALRALANSANAVADKATAPDDVLFVHRGLYAD